MLRYLVGFLVCVALGANLVTVAEAEGQRCTELGANCICSEPLQMTSLPFINSTYYNPSDSTVKECTSEGSTIGLALVRPTGDLTIGSDPTVLAALPAATPVQIEAIHSLFKPVRLSVTAELPQDQAATPGVNP